MTNPIAVGRPNLATVPAGLSFADAVATGLLAEHEGDPAGLADTLILVPNRRAARALAEAFLRVSDGRALVLPRMSPIGDVDEAELVLGGAAELELPPEILPLRRRLLLARLVNDWQAKRDTGPADMAQSARLADALASFIDEVAVERIDVGRLQTLVGGDYARHWEVTLDFLSIITKAWPAVLELEGCVDPATRRNQLLDAQARAWHENPPLHPVIAAGSTGSVPATADLLAVVARLPRGRVIFPGLDLGLDEESWDLLEATHPQWAMKQTLDRLHASRSDVDLWPRGASPSQRARLLSEAMLPARSTARWRLSGPRLDLEAALTGLSSIEAQSAPEEASAIALLMRETLEVPEQTAALVTHDRDLARRVAAELGRWGIAVDDSAGRPLATTPPGAFLRLLAEAAAEQLAPVPLLALLKHPLAAGGMEPDKFRRLARQLEVALLRGPRPGPGLAGLEAALDLARAEVGPDRDSERAIARLARLDQLAAFVSHVAGILGPFLAEVARREAELPALVTAHVTAAERLAARPTEAGSVHLWAGEAGQVAADFTADLVKAGDSLGAFPGRAYPGLFEALTAGVAVRPRAGAHPRLKIWGPLEARLQQADLVILGGLNEGTWPPAIPADPWLSRPMRAEFGLLPPERRIGLSAHDFAQAAAAPRVVLSRAAKVDGTPTVPSRWLLRLETLLGAKPAATPALAWADQLDPAVGQPVLPPAPCPPLDARPREASVSDVETWMRDPYALYARRVLRLDPLDPLDADPGAAERGNIIHDALFTFLAEVGAAPLGPDAFARLSDHGRRAFGPALARPSVAAFWWPRFEAVARWFIAEEMGRRANGSLPAGLEVKGEFILNAPGGPFRLTARADRVDRLADGTLEIIDYKTGAPPSLTSVQAGYAPQLPLEGVIALAGGFAGIAAAPLAALSFWRLSGGSPPGEVKPIRAEPADLTNAALAGLAALVARFDDPLTTYLSRPRPKHVRFGRYDHLARVAEWSGGGEGAEDDA